MKLLWTNASKARELFKKNSLHGWIVWKLSRLNIFVGTPCLNHFQDSLFKLFVIIEGILIVSWVLSYLFCCFFLPWSFVRICFGCFLFFFAFSSSQTTLLGFLLLFFCNLSPLFIYLSFFFSEKQRETIKDTIREHDA